MEEIFAFDDAHASVSPEARCAPQRRHSPLFAAIPFEILPPQRLQTGGVGIELRRAHPKGHVSSGPPTIPYSRISRVRF
jgi:hypothetical protein